jgi:hypothetical protein
MQNGFLLSIEVKGVVHLPIWSFFERSADSKTAVYRSFSGSVMRNCAISSSHAEEPSSQNTAIN